MGFASTQFAAEKWWDDAVIYQIFTRSYLDTDGDGIGNINGITEKLDYIKDLGVTAIWLTPFLPSGNYHGYDPEDYYSVDPDLGTMEDYEELIAEAHARDIKIIFDLVLNHCGFYHPWFQDAISNENSPYADWFVFSEEPVYGWGNATGNVSQPAWNDITSEGYYRNGWQFYAAFNSGLPDFNVTNQEVIDEFHNIVKFWVDKGVDGFRLDAIRYMIATGPDDQKDTPETIEWCNNFADYIHSLSDDIYVIGEVYAGYEVCSEYYTADGGMDQLFDFEISGRKNSIKSCFSVGKPKGIYTKMEDLMDMEEDSDIPKDYLAPFFSNHDSGRLPEDLQTPEKVKAAALIYFTLPTGTPYIYYGDEIGMREGKEMIGDAQMRNPMWWDGTKNAGFTTKLAAWTVKMKEEYYTNINVAAQENDDQSILSMFKKLIELRKTSDVLQEGDFIVIESDPDFMTYLDDPERTIKDDPLVCYYRQLDDEILLVLMNPGSHQIEVKQTIDGDLFTENKGMLELVDSFSSYDIQSEMDADIAEDILRGTFNLVLEPRDFYVMQMRIK